MQCGCTAVQQAITTGAGLEAPVSLSRKFQNIRTWRFSESQPVESARHCSYRLISACAGSRPPAGPCRLIMWGRGVSDFCSGAAHMRKGGEAFQAGELRFYQRDQQLVQRSIKGIGLMLSQPFHRAGHAACAAHAIGINPKYVQRTIYVAPQVVSAIEQNQAGRSFLIVPMDLPLGAFLDDFNFWSGSDGAGLWHGVLQIKVTRREQSGMACLNGC